MFLAGLRFNSPIGLNTFLSVFIWEFSRVLQEIAPLCTLLMYALYSTSPQIMSEASEKHDIIPKQKLHAYQNPWRKQFLHSYSSKCDPI